MRIVTFAAAAALAALAGCGSSDKGKGNAGGSTAAEGNQASAAPVAAAPGAAQIQPGEWEVTFATTNVSGTGIPPAALAAMRGRKSTKRDCITPEQARHPIDMPAAERNKCDYSHFAMGGGRIKGTISCAGDRQTKVALSMDGQFTGETYAYAISMNTQAPGGNLLIEGQASGRRVGECPAGSENGR
ncbi:MAG TPA: DUF3617 domain-containing protein [Allosphingosinicella sp.]|jgi:hypothetical protein